VTKDRKQKLARRCRGFKLGTAKGGGDRAH